MKDKSDNVSLEQKLEDDLVKMPLNIELIHDLPDHLKEPGYVYRPMILTYKYKPFRKEQLLKTGWELVYTDGNEVDHRGSATKSKPNVRKSPLITQRSSGHTAVWMKMKKELYDKRQKEKVKTNMEKLNKSVNVSKTEGGQKVQAPTIDLPYKS